MVSTVDTEVVRLHREFVGEQPYTTLVDRFSRMNFTCIRWDQVMTSTSTALLGSGLKMSSVQAVYTPLSSSTVSVVNSGYDSTLSPIRINGVSRSRDNCGVCRTVDFDGVYMEGDYWVFYITEDLSTFMVAAPILFKSPLGCYTVFPTFGLYVLTSDRSVFWSNPDLTKEIIAVSKEYGFTSIHNEPIASATSLVLGTDTVAETQRFRL